MLVDGELWTELSPDDPQIPLEIATGRVEHGCDFILTRVKPLSEAWWLARLSCFSLMILEETDSERRIFMAVKLGEARRMAISHRIHLSDLNYGRVARRQRIEGGRQRKKQSDEIVSRMASLVKQGKSISTAALIVYKKHKFGTSESANERLYFRTRKKRRHS